MKQNLNNAELILKLETAEKRIAELEQMQQPLRESEVRYHRVLDAMMEGCQIIDFDWRYVYVNDVVAKQGKRSPEKLLHHTMMEIYPGIENTEMFAALRRCMEERIPMRIENQFVFPDGSTGWFELSIQPTQEGIFVLSTDITERKQAEESLRLSEKRYQDIFERSGDGIFQSTPDGQFLNANPALARIYGYDSPKELIESVTDIARQIYLKPEDRREFIQSLQSKDMIENFEMKNFRKDGTIIWTSTSARAVRDEHGNILWYEGFLQDITKRKQAEEARSEAELRYRALFEQSHDAIFILDSTGGNLAVNQRAADMLGYSREELLGLSVRELSAEPAQSQQILQRLMNGERIPIYERLFRKKDGSIIPVEVNVELVHDAHGKPLHIQSVVRDITDRRQAETELQRRNDDLGLINAINEVIVQGGNLEAVVNVLAKEMKHIFSSQGCSIYMLSPDGHSLTMQQYVLPSGITRKIEKLIGSTIPIVQFPIKEGGVFHKVLQSERGTITSGPKAIQNWLTEFAETTFLPSIAPSAIRKLIPQIYKILNIQSTIIIPLRSNGKTIGFLNISSSGLFTVDDLERIENIGTQLTAAILHQQANEKILRSEEFLNSIQNALSVSIAILDETGTIVRVNAAWRKFGEQNGLRHPEACIGSNYLDICDSASGPNAEEAPLVARAIREVITGRRKEAWVEYPCHSSEEKRWFVLRVTKFEDGDKIWVVLAHENITERRQAQEAIQRNEAILVQAGKMAHLGAWEIEVSDLENLNNNVLQWSDEVYRIFGYEPGRPEITYDMFFKHVHPEDHQKVQWAMSQAIAENKSYAVEHRIIRPDGMERIVEEHADLIFDEHGQLIQMLGAVQDISERKKIEENLRETSEQFRTLFEASPEAIMLIDPQGDWPILDCNVTACTMNGYTREELVGQTVDMLTLLPGDPAGRAEYFEQIQNAGILRYEDFHRRKDGSVFPIEVSTSLITLGGREVILEIDRDITERKKAEDALRQSEQRYRALFEDMPVAIWEADLSEVKKQLDLLREQGVTDFRAYFETHPEAVIECDHQVRILDVNNAALQMYSANSKEKLLQSMQSESSQAELEQVREALISIAEGKLSHSWEGLDRTMTGEEIEISLAASVSPGYEKDYSRVIVTTVDITDRKKAEDALRESEEKYRLLFDSNPVPMWIYDLETLRFLKVNDAAIHHYGYSAAEFMSMTIKDIRPSEDVPKLLENISHVRDGIDSAGIWEHIKKDGSLIQVEIISHMVDFDGRRAELVLANDITKRIQAEAELRASEERFRQLANNIHEVFWITDAVSDEELYISPAAETIWGRSLDDLLQNNVFLETVLSEDRNTVLQMLADQKSGKRTEMEYRITRPDGSVRWIWDRAFPIFDDSGKVVRLAGVAADITKRKQAEEALHESELKYRNLVETSHDLIWAIDGDGLFTYLNQASRQIYGYEPEELIGHSFFEVLDPKYYPLSLDDFKKSIANKDKLVDVESHVRHRDGRQVILSANSLVLRDENKNVIGVVGTSRDITERKQNEAETRRRADEFAALYETARELAAQYNLPILLNTIVERARALLRAPGGGIYLYDETRDDLEMVLSTGSPIPTGTRVQMGEGMAGRVAQTQQRLIVDNYHVWAGRSLQIEFESVPFRAVLEVPMLYGGKLIGVLVVHEVGESERKFSEADAHLLSLFAEYAASAVHAARLLQETRRRAEETAALLETSLALTSLGLESTLQTLGDHAQNLFAADGCRIFLMEPDGGTLRCVLALQETPEAFADLKIKLGEGVTGAVAASGQAEIVNEMQNDPRAMQITGTPDEEEAIMFAPLKERDRTIGVLSVRRVGTQRPFQSSDLVLLEALASMAASAVSNARLFEETQRRLDELEALYVNGLAVGRLLEPRAIGERIIETFAYYLSWHHVTIRLCKDNTDELELIAFHLPHIEDGIMADEAHRMKSHVSRVGQGLSGWVVETGNPVRNNNLLEDPHYVNTYEGMQSGLYMPLKIGGRVIGVISVESEESNAFSEQDERLLATLAAQSATAFENARLYQSAQQEIWERRIAEDALRQSEENYRRLARELEERVYERTAEVQDLYDNAPCGYHSLDQDGHIIRINQTELNWLGYTREEVLGHSILEFITDESRVAFEEIFPTFKQQGSLRDFEIEMLRKDGSIFPTLVSATAIYDKDRRYLTSRSTLFDDTDRKHAMETLRLANSEMKRAMRMKDEFLASMSHELRTPLNAILGLSESLLEQTPGPINEKQQKYLGTVNESGRHLLELINDILDLAKIESGQIKLDPGRVNISTVCETSLRMIKQLAQKKNQSVEVEIENVIGYVWADERRLKQMMVNLLSNAVKFTPEGGQLGLKVRIDHEGDKLLITIWDRGIGIREQDLKRLFQPFVQLDSSLSRESAGTGLGLALVAEMARLHGGSISVSSQPGRGSEFTIILPWEPAVTTDTLDKLKITGRIPTIRSNIEDKQTILLVEDTDSVVLMLRDYLELSGYKVEIARDGLDGVSKSIALRPDLILMDVQMPGMDGLEATRRIRKEVSLKNIPIIALTALAMPSDRERCLEAGMNDYFSKPINLRELVKTMQKHLPNSGTEKKQ